MDVFILGSNARWPTVLAWSLVGLGEGLTNWGKGAPWDALLGLFLAWAGLGALCAQIKVLRSPWLAPLVCVMGGALIKIDLQGVGLILAGEGILVVLGASVWLLEAYPRLGLLMALPASLAGSHIRGVRPVLSWPPTIPEATLSHHAPTVLLLTVDTLRADQHLANFEKLAAEGRSGPTWATAPWTVPSLGSVMTGATPYDHEALIRPPVAGRVQIGALNAPTLASRFLAAGWRTAAFVENGHISPDRGFNRGFSVWQHRELDLPPRSLLLDPFKKRLDFTPLTPRGRDPEAQVDQAIQWLTASDAPAFLWVHLLGPHLPYFHADLSPGTQLYDMLGPDAASSLNIERLRRGSLRWTPELIAEMKAAYHHEAVLADAALGRLIAVAGPDAIILYTSDHGEELNDHGGWEHGHSLYDELLRVPLAFRMPGLSSSQWSAPASLIDVAPTLLASVGLDTSGLSGVDLRQEPPIRDIFFANTLYFEEREGILRWPYKYTRSYTHDQRILVDLSVDPGEKQDVCGIYVGLCSELDGVLDQEHAHLGVTPAGTVQEAVHALGYTE